MDEPTCVICDRPLSQHAGEDRGDWGACDGWTHHLWNADGTPKRPEISLDVPAFQGLAEQDSTFVNYARLQREAKANTPAGVGDIVHYWHDDACYAAIVTRAADFEEEPDGLFVFSDLANMSGNIKALHRETKTEGTWHWSESL